MDWRTGVLAGRRLAGRGPTLASSPAKADDPAASNQVSGTALPWRRFGDDRMPRFMGQHRTEAPAMAAQTHLFPCLQDNYGVLAARSRERRHRGDRCARGGAGRGRAEGDRLAAHRHPRHPSPRRSHRRHRRAQAAPSLPRRRPARRGGAHPAGRRDRARERQCPRRLAGGARARDAGTHRRPYQLLLPGRQARLRRRHAVLDRLRPRDRGKCRK